MRISLLVAMDETGGIGVENRLPWRLSDDLRRFKALTMGHHLVMGRRTFESIGRPLPGRTSIVITRNPAFQSEGVLPAHSLEQALALAESRGESEVFVIGGGEIFALAYAQADRIYLTRVHTRGSYDVYFPPFSMDEWEPVESIFYPADERNEYSFTFNILDKKASELAR